MAARILVVDPDAARAAAGAVMLLSRGYDVVAAHEAEQAAAHLRGGTFDVVLADLAAARGDDGRDGHDDGGGGGSRLLAEARRYPPQTIAVILTGPAGHVTLMDALQEGAYDFLTVPYAEELLCAVVARAVERVTLARTMRELVDELETTNAGLRMASDELQRRVDEATAELRQRIQQLGEVKEKLEEARRQREEFIAMVAHELSSPLTTVAGYAALLGTTDHVDGEGAAAAARKRARLAILSETRRMTRLVDDLAEAARVAAGHFQLRLGRCDLATVVREQVRLMQATARERRVRHHTPGHPVYAVCDRDRMAQVLANLLSNALKYARGGVEVRLEADGAEALLSVSDEGPGIAPEQLDAIFQPRVRLKEAGPDRPRGERGEHGERRERSTRGAHGRSLKGSGLGLAIARQIVEAHGGRIWAESGAGRGTTFVVRLPIRAAAAGEEGRGTEEPRAA